MGNDLSSVGNKFGLLAGLIGNVSTTTCGLPGKRTVAIHCRGGWSWNNLCVFDGPLEPADRYDGMKLAFGEGTEILKPYREGPLMRHGNLDAAGYNQLLVAVQIRQRSWDTHKDGRKSRVTNHAVQYHEMFPIWSWAIEGKYGLIISGAYALPALLPLPLLFIFKCSEEAGPMLVYCAIFVIFKIYVHFVLHINRHVSYIKISEESTRLAITAQKPSENQNNNPGNISEPSAESLWHILRERPDVTTKAPTSGDSIDDIRQGRVRLRSDQDGTEYLLVPVIGLQPFIGFDASQWWFLARRFRGPLLTISWVAEKTLNHSWSVAFAICSFVEAALQDDVARVFLADTSTHSVNWFRMLDDNHVYPEEYHPFRQDLPYNLSWSPSNWPWFGPVS